MKEIYYVYALIDPKTEKIFYVGKGSNKRWKDHFRKSSDLNEDKNKKIKTILEDEYDPEECFKLLHKNLKEKEAFRKEVEEIKKIGVENLTNINKGGKQPPTYKGKNHPNSKINEEKASEILWLILNSKLTCNEISEFYNVSEDIIKKISSGDNWNYVNPRKPKDYNKIKRKEQTKNTKAEKISSLQSGKQNPMYNKTCYDIWKEKYGKEKVNRMWEEKYNKVKGEKHSNSKLNKKEVSHIKWLYKNTDKSYNDLSKKYEEGKTTIGNIIQEERYDSVMPKSPKS